EILDAILYAFVENTRQSEEESFSRKLHNLEQSLSMQAQLREKLSLDSQKSKPGLRENLADMYEQLYMDTQQKIAAMRFQTDVATDRITILSSSR
ncbi:MAG: hypothetical protein MUF23_12550, partial [Pirellula sp.]|nr:hypothetical protein [Pirellula sp.]